MKTTMKNCTLEICYGAENAELGAFFRFMEKKHGTKRHVNAILAAGIDHTRLLEARLAEIGLLRGLGEKSAKEVIDGYAEWRESIMTPEQKKEKEMQKWSLSRAAQESTYEVGENCFFFSSTQGREVGAVPHLVEGEVRAIKMFFGLAGSQNREAGAKQLQFEIYVWNPIQSLLEVFKPKNLFRTKKEALASIKVSE